uniref:Cation/H+ exchanger transmembrane domain-containing protein n=1 Tax=Trieres chinensis TaxID=1514140 RepID=A0A7S2EVJ6_TRICV
MAATTEGTDSNKYQESGHNGAAAKDENTEEPAIGVLFPWFCEVLGVGVFFLLSRYCHALPYTAIMFFIGLIMGLAAEINYGATNQVHESLEMWAKIDGKVLLMIFLPGLLFWDAFNVNVYMFKMSFWQLLIMAFPMVILGAILTALIGYYVFPYGWSWSLAMTFGSILAATDPVAVCALLNEVGAPPRLGLHVSGESMLNDGSAFVFYTIFSAMFFLEMNIEGFGESVDCLGALRIFLQMSVGGALIGFAFGLGLIFLLFLLNHRHDNEENIIQVAATIAMAYASYYVSDQQADSSGILAVIACGITSRAFGENMINNPQMMESFWHLVEHLLNTLLFTLGGVVWGHILAETSGKDWVYLFLLYFLLHVIRFYLVFSFYPILSQIGLKTNLKEAFFISFGGLRGAVGIALSLSLMNDVWAATETADTPEQRQQYDEYRYFAKTIFGMVGGVAFLTLIINGTLSGPLLDYLSLGVSSETRERMAQNQWEKAKEHVLDDFVHLLTDSRFYRVNFAVVSRHVPLLEGLSLKDLELAIARNKEHTPPKQYKKPNLENVLPFLPKDNYKEAPPSNGYESSDDLEEPLIQDMRRIVPVSSIRSIQSAVASIRSIETDSTYGAIKRTESELMVCEEAIELRQAFIDILKAGYHKQIEMGELDGRGFLAYSLLQSLDLASDEISQGTPLNDWEASTATHDIDGGSWKLQTERFAQVFQSFQRCCSATNHTASVEYLEMLTDIKRVLAFISAHEFAQDHFRKNFVKFSDDISEVEMLVLKESKAEVEKAREELKSYESCHVEAVVSHLASTILLNKTAKYAEHISGL